jgi:hypothetical protein
MIDITDITLNPIPDDIEILHSKNIELRNANANLKGICIVFGIVVLFGIGYYIAKAKLK